MGELLVVIVDTSRLSSQTRNQIETLQQTNEILLENELDKKKLWTGSFKGKEISNLHG